MIAGTIPLTIDNGDSQNFMKALPNEESIDEFQYPGGVVMLTSHRLRMESDNVNEFGVVSIMLDNVSSCNIERCNYWLLSLTGLGIALFDWIRFIEGYPQFIQYTMVLAAGLLLLSLFLRKRLLVFSSSGASIKVPIEKGAMSRGKEFISRVERYRYEFIRRSPVKKDRI